MCNAWQLPVTLAQKPAQLNTAAVFTVLLSQGFKFVTNFKNDTANASVLLKLSFHVLHDKPEDILRILATDLQPIITVFLFSHGRKFIFRILTKAFLQSYHKHTNMHRSSCEMSLASVRY